ncbi:MAG: 50S ribosomal protein L13 [Armatimonadetes bacterium]|nr:50S ribosomal protein L13 [Armatimonadota bacterium]NIT31096.1 50S ribosomal protein L13 [Armatimonadota bacterium]
MKTQFAKKGETERKWYVVDAEGKVLGRLATQVASRLRGKHKPVFTPHVDTGDFVVVINADKVKFTGKKLDQKIYYRHSNYPGGLKSETLKERLEAKPEEVVRDAVWGMLPKNRLGRTLIKKLKVYRGAEHPHEAQKPEPLSVKE